jgi:hypothetical protein
VGRGVLKLVEFDRKGFQERLARMTLTSGQEDSIQIIESLCGALSTVACGVMGYKAWKGRKYSMIDPLIVFLLGIDFFLSLNLSVGFAATKNKSYCKFQVSLSVL